MAFLKLILFLLCIMSYFLVATPIYLYEILFKKNATSIRPWLLKIYSKKMLSLLGVNITLKNSHKLNLDQHNYLIVSNHLSYLDVLIISSFFPSYFITSLDMKATPFLGTICKIAQCLFVNRRSTSNLKNELNEINNKLKTSSSVVLFPEATSTNGERVLPFKKLLFQTAIESEAPVLPICLNYEAINNNAVTTENRDLLCWYGDMDFFSHLRKLTKQNKIHVSLTVMQPIAITSDTEVRSLADECFSAIDKSYVKLAKKNSIHFIDNNSKEQIAHFMYKPITESQREIASQTPY